MLIRWRWQIVALLAVIFYANTSHNQFALDDGLVFRDNAFVQKGIPGIPQILTHDTSFGSMGNNSSLAGGRYRPLPMIVYAFSVSFFGVTPTAPHLLNVLLYALTAIILLFFLEQVVFREKPLLSLAATIIFVIHPVHTEVVANIKSLDEILSLLFLLLTLFCLFSSCRQPAIHRRRYILGCLFYLLALFSKENGLAFVALIPVSIYFFTDKTFKEIARLSTPFWLLAVLYGVFRIALLGVQNNDVTEIMDHPYLHASLHEKYATILFVLLQYIKLLFYPSPLTYDYSYNQIPYHKYSDPLVIISLLIYAFLMIYAVKKLKKKDLVSWGVLFFLANLFIVSNVVFDVGAPMAERFLYLPSVAGAVMMVEVCRRIFASLHISRQQQKTIASAAIGILIIVSFLQTYARNADWFNDSTLMLHDVNISGQSARAVTYAGISSIRNGDATSNAHQRAKEYLQGIQYLQHSLEINPAYFVTYLNLGVAYGRFDNIEKAEAMWNKANKLSPNNTLVLKYFPYLAQMFMERGMNENVNHNVDAAIADLKKAVHYDARNAEAWRNLGQAYFTRSHYEKAKEAFMKSVQLNPHQQQAHGALGMLQKLGY